MESEFRQRGWVELPPIGRIIVGSGWLVIAFSAWSRGTSIGFCCATRSELMPSGGGSQHEADNEAVGREF
ncbi:hypothetical protein L484_016891 [Morus notabilis]|uniref:Uncharacterized protein n=1 Tax=Morus notabilis TaxID=981085 RepID=W9RVP6_9ROSA|nr:hypothetical protein L484_016891 [Morus notabilis]